MKKNNLINVLKKNIQIIRYKTKIKIYINNFNYDNFSNISSIDS